MESGSNIPMPIELAASPRLGSVDFSPFIQPASATGKAWVLPGLGFFILNVATAVLILRPADLAPAWQNLPIYQALMILCLAVSVRRLRNELSFHALIATPISVCILALLAAVLFSHLWHLHTYEARLDGWAFVKICFFYLLLITWVDSTPRLEKFLGFVTCSVLALATLALLQYHGVISLEPLATVRQANVASATQTLERLRGAGVFNDPNDFCLILVVAMGIAAYFMTDARQGAARLIWFAAFATFSYALLLTYSRGGFAALLGGVVVFAFARFGWRNGTALGLGLAAVAFFLVGGRQSHIDISNPLDTLQTRLQLWSEALDLFRAEPIFGIGQGKMVEEIGQVAHNSFLQSYAELGLLGGTALVGAFYIAMTGVHGVGRRSELPEDSHLHRMRPYLLGIVVAYAVGMLSLSRAYTVPTYLILGVAAAYLRISRAPAMTTVASPAGMLDRRLMLRLAILSVAFIIGTYLFVQLFVRWS